VTRTNKILIAVVALAAAGAAFWFLILSPKREEITTLDGAISAKQAEVAQAQAQLATYEQARSTYKRNYATLARLGKAVPADDDVRSLIIQIEATAEGTGVDFDQIELGSGLAGADSSSETSSGEAPTTEELASAPGSISVAGGALSAMPFSFTFTGGFFDLSTFFAKLEHFVKLNNDKLDATGRLLRIETVSIGPATSGFPEMMAKVGAATYIVPPVEAVDETPAPSGSQNASATTPSTPSSPGSTDPTTTATAGAAQ
jgi:Tfp pilus assembly protein PilO